MRTGLFSAVTVKRQRMTRPVGPAVDPLDRLAAAVGHEKILAPEGGAMTEVEGELGHWCALLRRGCSGWGQRLLRGSCGLRRCGAACAFQRLNDPDTVLLGERQVVLRHGQF